MPTCTCVAGIDAKSCAAAPLLTPYVYRYTATRQPLVTYANVSLLTAAMSRYTLQVIQV